MFSQSNACWYIGNFTNDPELKTIVSNGKTTSVTNFRLAVEYKEWKGGGAEPYVETSFLDFEAFDSGAERLVKQFKKGDRIAVTCRAKSKSWTDAQNNKRSKVVFRVGHFEPILRYNKQTEQNTDTTVDANELL